MGASNSVITKIKNQNDFEELFKLLFHKDRLVIMRTADTIEKVTVKNQQYLRKHKREILELCKVAKDKELKWHLALLIPRLTLDNKEFSKAWFTLTSWAKDNANSRIVRVNSIQGLFEMEQQEKALENDLALTLSEIEKENIPSINARIRKLKNVSR